MTRSPLSQAIRDFRATGAYYLARARLLASQGFAAAAVSYRADARMCYGEAARAVLAERPATLADPCCGCADCERSDGPFAPCRCGRA